jgi:hypothetical protein
MPHNQPFLTLTEALLYSFLLGLMTWLVRLATTQARIRRLIASESDSIVVEDLRKDSLRVSTIVWCFAPPICLWFGYLYVAHVIPPQTSQWWIAMSIPPWFVNDSTNPWLAQSQDKGRTKSCTQVAGRVP